MTGWKTKASGWLLILFGVLGFVLGLHDISTMIENIAAGVAVMGVGHKVEKAGLAYDKQQTKDLANLIRYNQRSI